MPSDCEVIRSVLQRLKLGSRASESAAGVRQGRLVSQQIGSYTDATDALRQFLDLSGTGWLWTAGHSQILRIPSIAETFKPQDDWPWEGELFDSETDRSHHLRRAQDRWIINQITRDSQPDSQAILTHRALMAKDSNDWLHYEVCWTRQPVYTNSPNDGHEELRQQQARFLGFAASREPKNAFNS